MQEISFGFVRQTPSQDDVLFEIKEKYTPQHDIIGLEKVIEELHSYRSSTVLHREVWKFKPVHATVPTVLQVPYTFVMISYYI